VDIIEYLLQRGADIEARTAGGQTPLFQTVPLASAEAFDCLLRKGARLGARDNTGSPYSSSRCPGSGRRWPI